MKIHLTDWNVNESFGFPPASVPNEWLFSIAELIYNTLRNGLEAEKAIFFTKYNT